MGEGSVEGAGGRSLVVLNRHGGGVLPTDDPPFLASRTLTMSARPTRTYECAVFLILVQARHISRGLYQEKGGHVPIP